MLITQFVIVLSTERKNMEWEEYKNSFTKKAQEENKAPDYIEDWLAYAKTLFDKNLPIIYSQAHFSELVGFDLPFILSITNSQKSYYKTYFIPKKNGKSREIAEPLTSLKFIQRWILENILDKCETSAYAKAYLKGMSVKDNAKFHKKQPILLTMDICDYFGTISFKSVLNFFLHLGYKKPVAVMLANLCTLNEKLPQGAPTSPALSNCITREMDDEIANYAMPRKIRYTRYADDIALSGEFDVRECIFVVRRIVERHGFSINQEKTHVRKSWQRQTVTGIAVNDKLQVPGAVRKRLRQEIYYIVKYGIEGHIEKRGLQVKPSYYLQHIIGQVSYCLFINPKDEGMQKCLKDIKNYMKEYNYSVEDWEENATNA